MDAALGPKVLNATYPRGRCPAARIREAHSNPKGLEESWAPRQSVGRRNENRRGAEPVPPRLVPEGPGKASAQRSQKGKAGTPARPRLCGRCCVRHSLRKSGAHPRRGALSDLQIPIYPRAPGYSTSSGGVVVVKVVVVELLPGRKPADAAPKVRPSACACEERCLPAGR